MCRFGVQILLMAENAETTIIEHADSALLKKMIGIKNTDGKFRDIVQIFSHLIVESFLDYWNDIWVQKRLVLPQDHTYTCTLWRVRYSNIFGHANSEKLEQNLSAKRNRKRRCK